MSKQNNANQGNYKAGDRNHPGEGIVQEQQKQTFRKTEKKQEGKGEKPKK
jgi:hypothetical protein